MPTCEDEDCGDECRRRVLCYHCGLYVCPWCWHHLHTCEPGHQKKDCLHLKSVGRYGRQILIDLRQRTLALRRVEER